MIDIRSNGERYATLSPHLEERGRRIFAASEAKTAGYSGIAAVARDTWISAGTIGGPGAADLLRHRLGDAENHALVIPIMLASLIAQGDSKLVCPEGVYYALSEEHFIPKSLGSDASELIQE